MYATILLRSQPYPDVCYSSGLTVCEEALVDGRWIGRYWAGHGFVEPDRLLV